MPNSPTIVSAALSDKELQDSINRMVANFDKGLQTMLEHSNEYVGKIQESLQKIGNTNFGAKGSNDGAVVKQTKAQKEATNETERRLKKEKEVNLTLDQRAEIMGRIPREMRMPDIAKSARESFQAFYKGFNEQARQLEPLIRSWERLLQSRHTGNIEQVAQQIRNVKSEIAAIIREQANLSRTKPQGYLEEIGKRNVQIKALRDQLVSLESEQQRLKATDPFKDNPYLDRLRAKHEELANAMRLSTDATYRLKQATAEELEIQRRRAEESMKSFYTHTMKMPTDQYDVQIAKLENIRALLQRIRSGEANFFTQTQVTGLEKEERRLVGLIGNINSAQQQVTSSTQQTTQAAQRYTEEIRKQAQAIRESQQWKEKGYTTIGDKVFYDPERSVASAKNRLSLEEQIILAQKKESEAAAIAAQEAISHAQAQKQVEEAAARTAQILETMSHYQTNVNKMQQDSTKLTSGRYGVGVNSFAQFDDLQVAISRVIGVEHQQIKIVDESYDSYKRLSASLSQLKAAYNSLNESERNSDNGRILVQRMQVIERSMQKIQAQAARPISLGSVMGLSEKTLDDIAYKMRQLASYRSGLNVETQVKEIEQVNKKYAQLQKNMNDIMQKNTDMIASNTALGRSWNYMKNRLAFYFTVGASTTFVKNLIDIRSQYELLERSIGILFDSMQTGSKIFSELNQMAIKSPFTTMELGSAAKQLSAYNIAAKDVVDTTRRLADMAAAVGIPIERLTYALGQIKSYGYLNSRDARMFANAGIPLIQNLADMYTKLEGRLVSIGDVYDRIKKKQVSFEDTLKVVHEMTDEGGRFFNFQEKAADTLKVRLANLTLAWNNMLNNMGKSNQGVLTSGLGVLKEMFENWRKIENLVLAIATNLGVVKAIQLLILLNAKGVTKQMALQEVLGKKLGATIYGIARNLKMLAVNPMTWLTVAITAVTYLSWKFWDLTTANENFNKSIADGTKENIASIDKFFDKYREDIESVGSMNTTDQEKMWERVREEIEKTTKNAQQYIDILEKIPELDKRVSKASGFLEQEKVIQEELNKLAQHGYFNIGGGFADDSYAEALTTIDKYTGEMIRKYGTYEDYIKAFKNEFQGFYDEFRDVKFSWNINEEIDESVKHFKKLESLNWGRILSGGTDEEKLARIRDTFMSLRDNFFATEEMQNAGAEAQALYNRHMDYWITSVAKANGLIKELTANGKTYSAEDVAAIEERRTEWELFFSYLSDEERRTMDYLVKTNQTGGEEFKKIWDTSADSMKKSNATAYRDLQKKIAELRDTPDIVINVVYREMRDKLDEQQQAFEDRWIRPENWSARNLSAEDYLKEETANRTKYGRLMRKTEEDNVEWEERLGKEYQENGKKIKSLNAQLQNKNNLSEADRKQKEKDLNLYKDLNKAIDDIGKAENFNYNQFKKGGKGGSKKDPLLDALKQEISLVEKLQSDYDKLSKSGASQSDALDTIRGAYGKTIRLLNTQLQSYGLPQIDISQLITGKDPNKALAHFKQTLNTLVSKGMLTLERSKELEAVVEKFTLSAKTYNLDMITNGLNNELGKLKDEYELAVELDANPELGGMFADYFGINLEELPKDYEQALKLAQKRINTMLKNSPDVGIASIDIEKLMSRSEFDAWVSSLGKDASSELIKGISDVRSFLYKVRSDETKKQIQEWDKMLEKYAEYEFKRKQITEEYEKDMEIARKRGASQSVMDAITNRRDRRYAELDFNEFMKTPDWIVATGDLAGLTDNALGMLIERIEEYKRTASNLEPKQIKQINKALMALYKEQRKGNPFKLISTAMKEAKNRTVEYDEAINDTEREIQGLGEQIESAIEKGESTSELFSKLESAKKRLEDLKKKQKEVSKLDFKDVVSGLQAIGTMAKTVGDEFASIFESLGDKGTAEVIKGITGTLDKTLSLASAGSVFGPWGAAIGGALGLASSLFSIFAGKDSIQSAIEDSERAVKRLENAYKQLEYAAENAFGAATSGAKEAMKANKELQLAELKRQLALEQSRDGKDRDEDRIIEIRGQIIDLEHEIKDFTKNAVNDLLGISSHGDFFENMISEMIEAFKNGEDAMEVFEEKWSDMIDNMIMKSIVSQVLSQWVKTLEHGANKILEKYTQESSKKMADLASHITNLRTMDAGDVSEWIYDNDRETFNKILKSMGFGTVGDMDWFGRRNWFYKAWGSGLAQKIMDAYLAMLDNNMAGLQDELDKQSLDATGELIDYYGEAGKEFKENYLGQILDKIQENWNFGQDSEKQLSNLQQGLQSMSESTAESLEAYMNSVSQQVYYHSSLLEQIRDSVVGLDLDVSLGVQSQMLLQLQNSYQTQQAIQQILEGVLVPSGRAFAVELIS